VTIGPVIENGFYYDFSYKSDAQSVAARWSGGLFQKY
jgi:threonyl-tRNA synthetase